MDLNTTRARRIRDRVPAEALAQYLGLGDGPKILCVWHHDTDPSLQIYEWGYRCFGACNRGFDVIHMAIKIKDFTFPQALDWLEETFGVDVTAPVEDRRREDESEKALWDAYETKIIEIVAPYIYETSDDEFEKMRPSIRGAYLYWDHIAQTARREGVSPSKVFTDAANEIRTYLEKASE